jgi:hypothetical protein
MEDHWSFEFNEVEFEINDDAPYDLIYFVESSFVTKDEYLYFMKEDHIEFLCNFDYTKDDYEYGDWDDPVRIELETFHYPSLLMTKTFYNEFCNKKIRKQ